MVEVASLDEVSVREVWPDEAHDFTPWLAENPEHLSKALHMDSLRAEVYVDDCVLNRARLYRDRRDFVIRSGDNGARED